MMEGNNNNANSILKESNNESSTGSTTAVVVSENPGISVSETPGVNSSDVNTSLKENQENNNNNVVVVTTKSEHIDENGKNDNNSSDVDDDGACSGRFSEEEKVKLFHLITDDADLLRAFLHQLTKRKWGGKSWMNEIAKRFNSLVTKKRKHDAVRHHLKLRKSRSGPGGKDEDCLLSLLRHTMCCYKKDTCSKCFQLHRLRVKMGYASCGYADCTYCDTTKPYVLKPFDAEALIAVVKQRQQLSGSAMKEMDADKPVVHHHIITAPNHQSQHHHHGGVSPHHQHQQHHHHQQHQHHHQVTSPYGAPNGAPPHLTSKLQELEKQKYLSTIWQQPSMAKLMENALLMQSYAEPSIKASPTSSTGSVVSPHHSHQQHQHQQQQHHVSSPTTAGLYDSNTFSTQQLFERLARQRNGQSSTFLPPSPSLTSPTSASGSPTFRSTAPTPTSLLNAQQSFSSMVSPFPQVLPQIKRSAPEEFLQQQETHKRMKFP